MSHPTDGSSAFLIGWPGMGGVQGYRAYEGDLDTIPDFEEVLMDFASGSDSLMAARDTFGISKLSQKSFRALYDQGYRPPPTWGKNANL